MKAQPLPKTESEHPGAMTELALRLSVAKTREEAVAEIVATYRKTRSMAKTAEKLQVGKRTLERWIDRTPGLREKIERVREELFPPR